MFDRTSRYYTIENATMTVVEEDDAAHGVPARVIVYKRRRFIPAAEGTTTLVEHTVVQGDRLVNVTARYLGDPHQFWRVCDANNVLRPDELEDLGQAIRIALPDLAR
jgi:hypothetical protein